MQEIIIWGFIIYVGGMVFGVFPPLKMF